MMSGTPVADRRAARRQATIGEIVDAAWDLSRERGLAGFSLRELGARVGMRAQSLYSYFASKHDLYDAMFADGNRALIDWTEASNRTVPDGSDVAVTARHVARRFFDFCVSDPVRHQLLFQRTIPDFVPSEASFALAVEALELQVAPLRDLGMTAADLDLATAVMSGMVAQQLANDPGGDRWERLIDRSITMLLREIAPDRTGEHADLDAP
jgi:AcrR family transcriptional regulator